MQKNNKKVGILTFTYGDNYGQRLQNLAMQEFLKQYFDEVYTLKQKQPAKSIKKKIKSLFDSKEKQKNKRHLSFQSFDEEYIVYYPKIISEETANHFPEDEFDYFVAGSDQIWSPFSPDVNSTMFMTFTKPEKRIAIAPSLSCEEIPERDIKKYTCYFKSIYYLSTREYQGSKLVKSLVGRDIPTFVDPTLLHDEEFWKKYCKDVKLTLPSQYCLCYCLGTQDDLNEISSLCKEKGLELINIMSDSRFFTMGPGEFLYLIKNATLVITDSYHGSIFSYIFKVPFLNFKRKGSELNMNSRFDTLYNKMGISSRYIDDVSVKEIMNMNFESIKQNINNEREIVEQFVSAIVNK